MFQRMRSLAAVVLIAQQVHAAHAQSATPAPAAPVPAADPASPAAPPAAVPSPSPDKQTGLNAWERLKGNTIEGKSAGQSVAEYFDAAGTVKLVDKDGLSTGTWTVDKNKVCFDFPEEDDRTCTAFEVTGNTGTAVDDDGQTTRFTILPGNSKGM